MKKTNPAPGNYRHNVVFRIFEARFETSEGHVMAHPIGSDSMTHACMIAEQYAHDHGYSFLGIQGPRDACPSLTPLMTAEEMIDRYRFCLEPFGEQSVVVCHESEKLMAEGQLSNASHQAEAIRSALLLRQSMRQS